MFSRNSSVTYVSWQVDREKFTKPKDDSSWQFSLCFHIRFLPKKPLHPLHNSNSSCLFVHVRLSRWYDVAPAVFNFLFAFRIPCFFIKSIAWSCSFPVRFIAFFTTFWSSCCLKRCLFKRDCILSQNRQGRFGFPLTFWGISFSGLWNQNKYKK